MRVSTLPGLTSKSIRTNKCQKVPYPWRASAQKKLTVPLLGPSTRVRCDHVLTAHIEARKPHSLLFIKKGERETNKTQKSVCAENKTYPSNAVWGRICEEVVHPNTIEICHPSLENVRQKGKKKDHGKGQSQKLLWEFLLEVQTPYWHENWSLLSHN